MSATVLSLDAVNLCGTASQGFPCCPIYYRLAVRTAQFIFSVFPTGLVVRVHLVLGSVVRRKYQDLFLSSNVKMTSVISNYVFTVC